MEDCSGVTDRASEVEVLAQYIRERLDCTALQIRNDEVESLWVSVKGMDNIADVIVSGYNC